jgi:hypothetical protein
MCNHRVCQRHNHSLPWHCFLSAAPPPRDYTRFYCRCGTQTQGGRAGLIAHQETVGCKEEPMLPLDRPVVTRR